MAAGARPAMARREDRHRQRARRRTVAPDQPNGLGCTTYPSAASRRVIARGASQNFFQNLAPSTTKQATTQIPDGGPNAAAKKMRSCQQHPEKINEP